MRYVRRNPYDPFVAMEEQLRRAVSRIGSWPEPPELIWWQDLAIALEVRGSGKARVALRYVDEAIARDDFTVEDAEGFPFWLCMLIAARSADFNPEAKLYDTDEAGRKLSLALVGGYYAVVNCRPDVHELESGDTPASLAARVINESGAIGTFGSTFGRPPTALFAGQYRSWRAPFDLDYDTDFTFGELAAGAYVWYLGDMKVWETIEVHARVVREGSAVWAPKEFRDVARRALLEL